MARANRAALLSERNDVPCHSKLFQSKNLPQWPKHAQVRGNEAKKLDQRVRPLLEPYWPVRQHAFIFDVLSRGSYSLNSLMNEGPYSAQLLLFGGAPGALRGLPYAPRPGQTGLRDEDNLPKVRRLLERILGVTEIFRRLLMYDRQALPPSVHNQHHVLYEQFLQAAVGNIASESVPESRFGWARLLDKFESDEDVLRAMCRMDETAWKNYPRVQREAAMHDLVKHESTGACLAVELECTFFEVIDACARGSPTSFKYIPPAGDAACRCDATEAPCPLSADILGAFATPAREAAAAAAQERYRASTPLSTKLRARRQAASRQRLATPPHHRPRRRSSSSRGRQRRPSRRRRRSSSTSARRRRRRRRRTGRGRKRAAAMQTTTRAAATMAGNS